MEKHTRNILVGGGIMTCVIVAAIGVGIVVLSDDGQEKTNSGYETVTPTPDAVTEKPGEISIEPMQIPMQRMPDGSIRGIGTVSALFRDFRSANVQVDGDPRISWSSDCIGKGEVIPAGQRCQITLTFRENTTMEPSDPTAIPELIVTGNSTTPGGHAVPLEGAAQIIGGNTATNPTMDGSAAPSGLDPYGPLAPQPAFDGSAPPIDYSQAPMPVAQPTLSPREQFLLSRRQAVFNGITRKSNAAQAQEHEQGPWAGLGIPTATSSRPQDMSRVVTMDRIITAVLARPFDSRTSQQVVAQVDRNVYSAHGRNILIPRGSRLIGNASGGGERIAISWNQIIRPDGARFVFEGQTGDAMGKGGVPGHRNERLLRRYGSILLGTVLSGGTAAVFGAEETASEGLGGENGRNTGAIISDIVRRDIERITQDIVRRNSQIQPIVTVAAGTRITIVPTMDLVMAPKSRRRVEKPSYPRLQNAGAPAPTLISGSQPQYSAGESAPIDMTAPVTPDASTAPAWETN